MNLEALCALVVIAVFPLISFRRGRKWTPFSNILKAFPAIALAALAFTAPLLHAQGKERTSIHKVPPVYPPIARQMGLTATVTVNITVDPSGKVTQAVTASHSKLFVPAAIDAAKQWKYTPADSTDTFSVDIIFEKN
jgi:TonB family protein